MRVRGGRVGILMGIGCVRGVIGWRSGGIRKGSMVVGRKWVWSHWKRGDENDDGIPVNKDLAKP